MKKLIALLLIAMMVVSFAACSKTDQKVETQATEAKAATSDPGKVFHWKIASIYADPVVAPEFNSTAVGQQVFVQLVEERSGGRIKFDSFYGGVLGSNGELFEQCRNGELEVFNGMPYSNYDSRFAITSIPFLFNSLEEIRDIACDPNGEMYGMIKEWMAAQNMEVIGIGAGDIRGFVNNKREVKTVDDLKGLNVRTYQDAIVAAFWSGICNTNTMPSSEVYTSLQTGAIDGLEFASPGCISNKYYEVCKYYTQLNWQWCNGFTLAVSDKAMAQLPDDLKEIVRQCGIEAAAKQSEMTIADDKKAMEELTKKGVICYTPTEEELKTFKDYAETVADKVREFVGDEAYEKALKAVADYRATH